MKTTFEQVMIVSILFAVVAICGIAMYMGHVETMAKLAAGCVK